MRQRRPPTAASPQPRAPAGSSAGGQYEPTPVAPRDPSAPPPAFRPNGAKRVRPALADDTEPCVPRPEGPGADPLQRWVEWDDRAGEWAAANPSWTDFDLLRSVRGGWDQTDTSGHDAENLAATTVKDMLNDGDLPSTAGYEPRRRLGLAFETARGVARRCMIPPHRWLGAWAAKWSVMDAALLTGVCMRVHGAVHQAHARWGIHEFAPPEEKTARGDWWSKSPTAEMTLTPESDLDSVYQVDHDAAQSLFAPPSFGWNGEDGLLLARAEESTLALDRMGPQRVFAPLLALHLLNRSDQISDKQRARAVSTLSSPTAIHPRQQPSVAEMHLMADRALVLSAETRLETCLPSPRVQQHPGETRRGGAWWMFKNGDASEPWREEFSKALDAAAAASPPLEAAVRALRQEAMRDGAIA